MAKFVWQDGTLVSKAKVKIGGTIYEVDPEEYSGSTPLSASNLNAMVDQTYQDLKDYVDDVPNIVLDGPEVKMNYKVDGKDVYAKRFTLGTGTTAGSQKSFDISSKGFSQTNYSIVRYEIIGSNGLVYPSLTGDAYSVYAWLNTKTQFKIKNGTSSGTNDVTFYATMYYTKTTN